jgi:hypothetical protein
MISPYPTAIKDTIDDPLDYLCLEEQIAAQNKANYELFISTYNRDECVSFLGAGVSKSLGISDWDNLIDDLCKETKKLGLEETIPSDKNQYPDFAERIFSFLYGKHKTSLYFDTIAKRMTPHINSTSLTLVYLALSLDIHLTTNFDRSIEHAYRFIVEFSEFLSATNRYGKPTLYFLKNFNLFSNGPSIYYLHGSINEGIYILKKSDYDIFYPSVSKKVAGAIYALEDCLKHFFMQKNIIFIGFSFEDPYVRKFFFNLAKDVDRERLVTSNFYSQGGQSCSYRDIKHFILLEEGNKSFEEYGNEIFSKLKEYHLYPVIYQKNKHIFLEYLFKTLIGKLSKVPCE